MSEAHSSKSELQYRNTGVESDLLAALRERGAQVTPVPIYKWALPDGHGSASEGPRRHRRWAKSTCCSSPTPRRSIMCMQLLEQEGTTAQFKEACKKMVVASIGPTASERLPPLRSPHRLRTLPLEDGRPSQRNQRAGSRPSSAETISVDWLYIGLAFRVPMEIHSLSSGSLTRGQARRLPHSVRLSILAERDWHRRGGTTGCGV